MRPAISILSIFLIFIALTTSGCSPDEPEHNQVREAIQLKKDGKYAEAIAIYDQLIKQGVFAKDNDNLAIVYYNRALAEFDRANLDQAVQDYSSALKLRPEFPTCLHNRSVVYEKMGDISKAIADVQAILKIEPNDGDAKERLTHLQAKASAN